ncbi:MAG TPA: AraC family transcriptional regulator [Candidatus Blautia faecavium]|uniref:AraC family transcriptional regulator n=1 Tax=Candidatus Blautia faecavium TaxID=2838487 RepID=A0A9D2LRR7_9FIRM|nr:AraC family transcriptional regulator [Candidatus Blautia faecavium]
MKIRLNENQQETVEGLHTEFPYVLHRVELRDTKIPWHWHEELEFNYVVSGRAKVATTDKSYILHQDEACFINSNVLSIMVTEEAGKSCRIDSHLFHPVFLGGHFRSLFETKYLSPVLQNRNADLLAIRGENADERKLLKKLKHLAQIQEKNDVEFETRNILSEIWLLLIQEIKNLNYPQISARWEKKERIQTMMAFIHENYSEKLTLEEIADSALVSKRECLRCFQESIHKTPFAYLKEYRIEMAEKLLKTTELSVMEIGLRTGFSNNAYFGKTFKEVTGKTPGEYRKACPV